MGVISRAAGLAAVPVKGAAKLAAAATSAALGAEREAAYAKAATDTIDILAGALARSRGPAMKFGQGLALFSTMLPPEQAHHLAALGRLYEDAEPRPFAKVQALLTELPSGVMIEEAAIKAASLGQVHRGVWTDGTEVAIKIQYPDAKRIVRADMFQLRTMTPIIQRLLPGVDIKALLEEHGSRLEDELDYQKEAQNQKMFRKAWSKHPGIVTIPKVLYASPHILVTTWLPGEPWTQVHTLSKKQRRQAGKNLSRFIMWSPHIVGATHADPHPGNYRLCPDGTLGVLDFGAIAKPAGVFTSLFADTFKLWEAGRLEELREEWIDVGLISEEISVEDLIKLLNLDLTPYQEELFAFTPEWAASHTETWVDPAEAWNRLSSFTLPPELLLEHRAVTGCTALLVQGHAIADFRTVLDAVLPLLAKSQIIRRTP